MWIDAGDLTHKCPDAGRYCRGSAVRPDDMGFNARLSMRRSARVQVRIPVDVAGTLPGGEAFTEETYVLTVSKFGAKLKSSYPLSPGMEIRVRPRAGLAEVLCRVVWAEVRRGSRPNEVGIQYVNASNLFGVAFPD